MFNIWIENWNMYKAAEGNGCLEIWENINMSIKTTQLNYKSPLGSFRYVQGPTKSANHKKLILMTDVHKDHST